MVRIKGGSEQARALAVWLVEEARDGHFIDVSSTRTGTIYATRLNRTKQIKRCSFIDPNGETKEVESK